MDLTVMIILGVVFFATSFFASVTGGAALLSVPILMVAGLTPYQALATNKLGSLSLSLGATISFQKNHVLPKEFAWPFLIFVMIGAVVGSLLVVRINEAILEYAIIVVMLAIAILLAVVKQPEKIVGNFPQHHRKTLLPVLGVIAGVYLGFYGAGFGIMVRFVLASIFAFTLLQSAALSAFSNIGSSALTLLVFSLFGFVQYHLAVPIVVGSFVGALFGARYGTRMGSVFVKKIMIALSVGMATYLIVT